MHIYIRICIYMCVCIPIDAYIYIYKYIYIYICIYTYYRGNHHCEMDDLPPSTLPWTTQAVTQDGHALRYASPQLRADPHFAPPSANSQNVGHVSNARGL